MKSNPKKYAGVNVTFPQRLFSKEYTYCFIRENRDEMITADIAREVGLS